MLATLRPPYDALLDKKKEILYFYISSRVNIYVGGTDTKGHLGDLIKQYLMPLG